MSAENSESPKWQLNRKLALIAWALFAISLICPFLLYRPDMSGLEFFFGRRSTFLYLINDPFALFGRFFFSIQARDLQDFLEVSFDFHYLILMCAILFMLCSLPLCLSNFQKKQKLPSYMTLSCWFFFFMGCLYPLEAVYVVNFQLKDLGFGYFMWVSSFGLLAFSIRENKAKQEA
jgi:hypothetical protein